VTWFHALALVLLAALLPPGGTFVDDDGSPHEPAIEAIVAEGVTFGCNPPVNDRYCPRSEVSGTRLWGAIAQHYGRPERFFEHHFVANYCPLLFIESSGRNRTPDKLPADEREPLFGRCDAYLRRLVDIFEAEWVVGVGSFAEQRARHALGDRGVRVGRILHPSPANPRAHPDWSGSAKAEMKALGLCGRRVSA